MQCSLETFSRTSPARLGLKKRSRGPGPVDFHQSSLFRFVLHTAVRLETADADARPNEMNKISTFATMLFSSLTEDPKWKSPEPLEQEQEAAEEEGREPQRMRPRWRCGIFSNVLGKVSDDLCSMQCTLVGGGAIYLSKARS